MQTHERNKKALSKKSLIGLPTATLLMEKSVAKAIGVSIGERLHEMVTAKARDEFKKGKSIPPAPETDPDPDPKKVA